MKTLRACLFQCWFLNSNFRVLSIFMLESPKPFRFIFTSMPLNTRIMPFKIFISLFGLLYILSGCGEKEQFIYPIRQDIVESVYASATVQPENMYRAYAAVTGILEENLVEEGQVIRAGDELIKVSNPAPELSAENARLQMVMAESNYSGENSVIKDLETQIRTTILTFYDDSLNFIRQEKLWKQGIGSQSGYESRKLVFERSKNQLIRLKSEYKRLDMELRNKLEQARNAYAATRANSDEFTVRSTIDGKVYALYKEPGEMVIPNEALAMLGSTDTFLLELRIDEVDVVRIQVGQKVLINLDAYRESVFEAEIFKIYPQKDTRNQTFKVEARFSNPPSTLYPGLSGEANIIVNRREKALTIPKSHLAGSDSVLTPSGMRKVKTGISTLDRVEIVSGLNESDPLLKPAQ